MGTIYKHEIKANSKSLLIWSFCVGGMGALCILLFASMQESMGQMAENFASMGALSDAFGMSQLSIATLPGFYAAEVGTIHALGGAMFAAVISSTILSKEEDGHTSEFLFTLPVTRGKVVAAKGLAVLSHIVVMNVVCVGLYQVGIHILGEEMPWKEFLMYHGMQLLMDLEIAGICFAISAFLRKNKLGIGLGMVLMLYAWDLITRVIPDLSDHNLLSPFSYANASDIFSKGEIPVWAAAIGAIVLTLGFGAAYLVYRKKDLAP